MLLLIIFFVVSILFSFLCSIWEAVLLSIPPAYIRRKLAENNSLGTTLQAFKEDIDRPLSAILTLNTIAHTVGAIGVGVQAGEVFGQHQIGFWGIHLSYESLIAGVMTFAILILSEIIPKTLGANLWRRLVPFTVRSISILMILLRPFVWISQLITKSLKKDKEKSVLSRADFTAMAKEGEMTGTLARNESTIIKNLITLEDLIVRDIMTPRTVLTLVDENLSVREVYDKHKNLPFSRIPVYDSDPDQIVGLVLKDDILMKLADDKDRTKIKDIKREINHTNDKTPLPKLFDFMISQKIHLSTVVDEFGMLVGIVTMEDLLETILGLEITDETDAEVDLQKLARKKWEERAKNVGLLES